MGINTCKKCNGSWSDGYVHFCLTDSWPTVKFTTASEETDCLNRYGMPVKTAPRIPLSEYSLDEIRQFLSSLNLSMMETDILDDMVKKVSTVARKCYKPCCAAKTEPIDWSTSWNPDYDDHG